jgi:hypothetical protein
MLGSHTFPMAPAGGLFIAVMGCCVALGGPWARQRKALLIIGAVLATGALVGIGPILQTGHPTSLQVGFLIGSILLEGVLVRVAFALNRRRNERRLMLSVLLAVGLHFLPMAVAFGPLCLVLSAACVINALVGLRLSTHTPLARLWFVDGIVKVLVGAAMMGGAATALLR